MCAASHTPVTDERLLRRLSTLSHSLAVSGSALCVGLLHRRTANLALVPDGGSGLCKHLPVMKEGCSSGSPHRPEH